MKLFDVDYLYPLLTDEILPGDTYDAELTLLGRLTTPITPFMDNVRAKVEAFAVPHRLTQDNWVKLQGERVDPDDSIDYSRPYITTPSGTGFANETLWTQFSPFCFFSFVFSYSTGKYASFYVHSYSY